VIQFLANSDSDKGFKNLEGCGKSLQWLPAPFVYMSREQNL